MSLGTIAYDAAEKFWIVKALPHISMRFKRVFGGVKKGAVGELRISDTIDNARDLLWFTERYPLEVLDMPHLHTMARSHVEREEIVGKLLANRTEPRRFDLAIPARQYQCTAAELLLANNGLLLADDVGLGKTASFICALTDPRTLPCLVVTLTHLPRQWKAEINRFAPDLKVHIVKKGTPYDMTEARSRRNGQAAFPLPFPDVVIINYHKLSGWAETLAPVMRSVVYDEVQELRHMGSQKYLAAEFVSKAANFRCGLSATPIYNYGNEMYSIMNCVSPGALGEFDEFKTEWCNGDRIREPKAFSSYLRSAGLMLRRTRNDVGRELPPLTKITHTVQTDHAALDKVGSDCAELARMILASGEAYRGQKMQASEELSNLLRQATGIAKAPYVAEFVKLLIESGEKVVVFAWHREVYSILLNKLAEYKPVMYTGTESVTQKQAAKEAFVNGDAKVILISLRSGAGLDGLQKHCRTVVFAELDWSPGVHEQNIGRVYRDGQQDNVMAYFLVSEEGADPPMCEVLGLKKSQVDGVRDVETELVEKLEIQEGHIRKLAEAYLAQRSANRLD